jgi:hypothetical protein
MSFMRVIRMRVDARCVIARAVCMRPPREILEFCTGISDITRFAKAFKEDSGALTHVFDTRYAMMGNRLNDGWFATAIVTVQFTHKNGKVTNGNTINWEKGGVVQLVTKDRLYGRLLFVYVCPLLLTCPRHRCVCCVSPRR